MRCAILAIIVFVSWLPANGKDDICLDWFKQSGLSPTASDCILRCDILDKDMSTFMCAERCDEFCEPKKCEPDLYWKEKIKSGRPSAWDMKSEVTSNWTESEKGKLLELLSRLPDDFKHASFNGFFRMKKSVDPTNPGTTSDTGQTIVIYDRAFANPFFSTSRVIAHELGHTIFLHFKENERQDYRNALKWKVDAAGLASRPGSFVSSRAKDNADEDFAENLSFFLFEPDHLKSVVPLAYQWISKKFSKNFKLKEECKHAKK